MNHVRVMILAGSSRAGSLNRKLAACAATMARARAAHVTEVDLRALALPLYDGDVEALGQPAGALELRRLFATHDAMIVASPEYNGFVAPLLVNALHWASRPKAGDGLPDGLAAMRGTVAGVVSASPGIYGGVRGLVALRSFLTGTLGFFVVSPSHSVPRAHEAFDTAGNLADAAHSQALERLVDSVLATAGALGGKPG